MKRTRHFVTKPNQRPTKRMVPDDDEPFPVYFSVTWPATAIRPSLTQYFEWMSRSYTMSVLVQHFLLTGRRDELHVNVVHALLSLIEPGNAFMSTEQMLVVLRQAMARTVANYEKARGITSEPTIILTIRQEVTASNLGRVIRRTNPVCIQQQTFTPCYTVCEEEEEEDESIDSDHDECRSSETVSSEEESVSDSFVSRDTDDESLEDSLSTTTTTTTSSSTSSDTETDDDEDDIACNLIEMINGVRNLIETIDGACKLIEPMRLAITGLEKKFNLKK